MSASTRSQRADLVGRWWPALVFLTFLLPPPMVAAAEWKDLQLEVEGRSYHVRIARGVHRGPSFVLESGIAAKIGHWDTILPELGKIAPVLAYERPGIGTSPEAPEYVPTPENVAGSLRALVRAADMPAPFILVGHSLGGIYAKAFVDRYPRESGGLVLIDPTDFNESWDDWCRLYEEMGVGPKGRRLLQSELDRLYGMESAGVQREWEVLKVLRRASFEELPSLNTLRGIPVRVLVGARIGKTPEAMNLPDGFSFEDFQIHLFDHRHRNLWRWIMQLPDLRIVVSTGSGHFVHQEEPAMVLRELREMFFHHKRPCVP